MNRRSFNSLLAEGLVGRRDLPFIPSRAMVGTLSAFIIIINQLLERVWYCSDLNVIFPVILRLFVMYIIIINVISVHGKLPFLYLSYFRDNKIFDSRFNISNSHLMFIYHQSSPDLLVR